MDRREFVVGAGAVAAATALPIAARAEPITREAVKYIIMPDIRYMETAERTARDNIWTIRYKYMNRWRCVDGRITEIEIAQVGSERYAQWLAESPACEPLPHIQFGGAVVAGEGDPAFYLRWRDYAMTLE